MTDVFGFTFPNTQLVADQFAANGYFTVIPDVFNGNEVPFPLPADWDLAEYMENKMPRVNDVDPIYAAVIEHLRGKMGVKRVGGVGYCFGGKYVCRWLRKGALDAGFVAHPSFVEEDEVKGRFHFFWHYCGLSISIQNVHLFPPVFPLATSSG